MATAKNKAIPQKTYFAYNEAEYFGPGTIDELITSIEEEDCSDNKYVVYEAKRVGRLDFSKMRFVAD